MAEIRITGFEKIEAKLDETLDLSRRIYALQQRQPEYAAMMGCINTMQSILERVVLAYEKLAGGQTPESIEARHAMNAAMMLQKLNGPWKEFVFPEEISEERVTRATRLVKKYKADLASAAKKKPAAKKGKRK